MTNKDSEDETEDEGDDDEEDRNKANGQTKEQKTEENKSEEGKEKEEQEAEKEKNETESLNSSTSSETQSPPPCLTVLLGADPELGPQLLEAAANGENHNSHFFPNSVAPQSFHTMIWPQLESYIPPC